MQDEVADGVRLIVRPPPEIVFTQDVEALLDMYGEFVDQTSGDVLEQVRVDRFGHPVMISSNVATISTSE
jgi:hypothetical protein